MGNLHTNQSNEMITFLSDLQINSGCIEKDVLIRGIIYEYAELKYICKTNTLGLFELDHYEVVEEQENKIYFDNLLLELKQLGYKESLNNLGSILIKEYLECEIENLNNDPKYFFKRKLRLSKWLNMAKKGYTQFTIDSQNKNTNRESSYNGVLLGLENYHRQNKSHFIERVVKSPPSSLRWLSWQTLLPNNLFKEKYIEISKIKADDNIEICLRKDIRRTFPKYNFFPDDLEERLFRVLRSFAILDPEINYCQGMNFIVGFLLIISNYNEEETFSTLVSLFEKDDYILRGFYLEEFAVMKFYIYVLEHLIKAKLPDLDKLLEEIGLPCETFTSSWFLAFFVVILPVNYCVRIWDCVLSIGIHFLINFAISFLYYFEEDILTAKEAAEFLFFRKRFIDRPLIIKTEQINYKFDIEKIIQHAKSIDVLSTLKNLEKKFKTKNCRRLIDFKKSLKIDYRHKLNNLYEVTNPNNKNQNFDSDKYSNLCSKESFTNDKIKAQEINSKSDTIFNVGNILEEFMQEIDLEVHDEHTNMNKHSNIRIHHNSVLPCQPDKFFISKEF